MDEISKEAIRKMHDELDTDEDGNVSMDEGAMVSWWSFWQKHAAEESQQTWSFEWHNNLCIYIYIGPVMPLM